MSLTNTQKPDKIQIELKQIPRDDSIEMPPLPDPAPPKKTSSYRSPYERAGFFSKLNFLWVYPFVKLVNQLEGPPKLENVPELGDTEKSEIFEARIQAQYEKWKKKHPNKKPNLFIPAMLGLKDHLIPTVCFISGFMVFRIMYGFFLNQTIAALSDPNETKQNTYLWALGMILCIIGCFYNFAHSFYHPMRASIQLKMAVIMIIYKKINRVSLWSLQQISLGKVVNLVANDVNVFEVGVYFICLLCLIPAIYIGSAILLWSFFGPPCLVGIGYVILTQPINSLITRMSMNARMIKNKLTDERVKMTNEAIDSIRLLKMYGWELNFKTHIENLRKKEIRYLKIIAMVEFIKQALSHGSSAVASFLIFLTYVLNGNTLSPSQVFPTVFICNFLRVQGGTFAAIGYNILMDATLFFERVVQVLEIPEVANKPREEPKDSSNAIEFENYFAYWQGKPNTADSSKPSSPEGKKEALSPSKTIKPTLSDLNMKIKRGTLTAVIGKIGSGKTTLLLSLAGEIPYSEGSQRYNGKIAYVEQ